MELSEALNFLNEKFCDLSTANTSKSSVREDQYRLIIDSIEQITAIDEKYKASIRLFLYHSCGRFDRFVSPTPFVINSEYRGIFEKSLTMLIKYGESIDNTAVFQVHKVRWDLHDYLCSQKTADQDAFELDLQNFHLELDKIEEPKNPSNLEVFNQERLRCFLLINAARNNTIKTKVTTKLPLSPVMSNTSVTTTWNSVPIKITFTPKFEKPDNTFANTFGDSVIIPMTPSQWQNSTCGVVIEFNKLIESSLPSVSLAAHSTEILPHSEWPNIFKDVYDILDTVIWHLREKENIHGRWLLLPSDIATVHYQLWAGDQLIEGTIKDSPGLLMQIRLRDHSSHEVNLEISQPIPWHVKCKRLADSYIQTGETNEALFWLNVGIESFFDMRTKEICSAQGADFNMLSSGKSYWQNAEEIISEQFPELTNQIKWPDAGVREPSWFVKIKYLGKNVKLEVSSNDILSRYSSIQKFRNALFHGSTDERVPWREAKKAFDSYIWIENNFR